MYIPNDLQGPTAAVLFVCGHHEQAKHQDEYQIVCRHLVSAGFVVLAIDPIGQGERFSYYRPETGTSSIRWGTHEHDHVGAQCLPLGDALGRYFVHDAIRGIDYLCTRPEVDPDRIGLTGNSGGGTQSSMIMMADPRIAAAAPATFIMNREEYMYAGQAQDAEQLWPGLSKTGFDHEDILLAMAPKPVLVLAVAYDFFPIEGTLKTVSRVRRFWEMRGKADLLQCFVDRCDHHYTPLMAVKTAEFFSEHLLGDKRTPCSDTIRYIDPPLLWCTEKGQVIEQFADSRIVYDENLDRLREVAENRKYLGEPRAWLRDKVFGGRKPCDLNIRHLYWGEACELTVTQSIWRPQEGMFSYAQCYRHVDFKDHTIPVTMAIWDGGTTRISRHADWIRKECGEGRAVLVLDVAGAGACEPNAVNPGRITDFYGTLHKLAFDLIWLGDSIPALRTFDVIRAVDALQEDWDGIDATKINLYLTDGTDYTAAWLPRWTTGSAKPKPWIRSKALKRGYLPDTIMKQTFIASFSLKFCVMAI